MARRLHLHAATITAFLLMHGACQPASAQDKGSLEDLICPNVDGPASPLTMGRKLAGIDCEGCHSRQDRTNENLKRDWIRRDEYTTWSEKGRHRQAYKAFTGKLGKHMEEVLEWGPLTEDARCLACHSTLPVEWMLTPESTLDAVERLSKGTSAEQSLLFGGVTCEACHGAYDSNKAKLGWREPHTNPNIWKYRKPEDKQGENGKYDVRSPVSRTRMCVSCHVGDAERGRVVTHEMYAAGHPPLPAFEVETFLRDMPPHWRTLHNERTANDDYSTQKSEIVSSDFLTRTRDNYLSRFTKIDDKDASQDYSNAFERTRSLVVGAMVTWGQNARLTASLASTGEIPLPLSPEIEKTDHWPELAAFECAACHHDLKTDGWRAKRSPVTKPGRPLLRHWSSPLFLAVYNAMPGGTDTPAKVQRFERFLTEATERQPFGDRKQLSNLLTEMATYADEESKRLEKMNYTKAEATRLLLNIAKVGKSEDVWHDYESARHLVWAFDEVRREIDPSAKLDRLNDLTESAKLYFINNLASSTVRKRETVSLTADGEQSNELYLIDLPKTLEKAASYDARRLRIAFKNLHKEASRQLGSNDKLR